MKGAPPHPPAKLFAAKLGLALPGVGVGVAGAIVCGLRVAFVFVRMPAFLAEGSGIRPRCQFLAKEGDATGTALFR